MRMGRPIPAKEGVADAGGKSRFAPGAGRSKRIGCPPTYDPTDQKLFYVTAREQCDVFSHGALSLTMRDMRITGRAYFPE